MTRTSHSPNSAGQGSSKPLTPRRLMTSSKQALILLRNPQVHIPTRNGALRSSTALPPIRSTAVCCAECCGFIVFPCFSNNTSTCELYSTRVGICFFFSPTHWRIRCCFSVAFAHWIFSFFFLPKLLLFTVPKRERELSSLSFLDASTLQCCFCHLFAISYFSLLNCFHLHHVFVYLYATILQQKKKHCSGISESNLFRSEEHAGSSALDKQRVNVLPINWRSSAKKASVTVKPAK